MFLILLSRGIPVCFWAIHLSISSLILLTQSGMIASKRLAYRGANQLSCLAHNGQILARGDDEDSAGRRRHGDISVRRARFVSSVVELQTQVVELLANPLADFRRMLTYSSGKH